MKLVNKSAAAGLMVCAALMGGTVQAQQFFCTVQEDGNSNWIPAEFLIDYSGGAAIVTHPWVGQPSVREVPVRGSGNQRRLSYTLSDVGAMNGQRTTMRVTLRHNVQRGSLQVVFDPIQYANRFTGAGGCVAVQ